MNEGIRQIKIYNRRIIHKYGLSWTYFFKYIEELADQYQENILSDKRSYLLSLFGYEEIFYEFDYYHEVVQREFKKRNSPLNRDEARAFLRLYVLLNMLDNEFDKAPNNDADFKVFLLTHPLWVRIENQARLTLDLFRKNRCPRNIELPSMTRGYKNRLVDYHHRVLSEYGLDWGYLFKYVEDMANYKTVLTVNRNFILSTFGFNDVFMKFDDCRNFIRQELAKKGSPLQRDEGLAFLRLHILMDKLYDDTRRAPKGDKEFRSFILNHPLWHRIEKQARVTLELFKKNRHSRMPAINKDAATPPLAD